ncbi:DgyrCDS12314 [Dimorphilus gyrociliatus]|uniref:DgyrCDS12314 n=1 Tax=Dimorphilus gyrociliatus TaxID=2664684 RepID=A0A7I8W8J2_9ANNE|nr:DgyrCDS12314 [Dimorphilus gyrociliatus]
MEMKNGVAAFFIYLSMSTSIGLPTSQNVGSISFDDIISFQSCLWKQGYCVGRDWTRCLSSIPIENLAACSDRECVLNCENSNNMAECLNECKLIEENNFTRTSHVSDKFICMLKERCLTERNGESCMREKCTESNMRRKRYRLGLYDCIVSYCGSKSGPMRRMCIIQKCNRETLL